MGKIYKIVNITHSGREGIRGTPISDEKHKPLLGAKIRGFNPLKSKIFEVEKWILIGNPAYDWWQTSAIIQLMHRYDGNYILETINTIYELEEV